MTDQTRISVPTQDSTGSSIERAVESFGWSRLSPPPVRLAQMPAPKREAEAALREAERPSDLQPIPTPVPAEPSAAADAPAPLPRLASRKAAQPKAAAPKAPLPAAGEVRLIDRDQLRRHGFIVPEAAVTGLLEEFRIVKRQLLQQCAELQRQGTGGRAQRVLICSPHPGEGKTYCAVNLALATAAEKESEVLLVDADFGKPSVVSVLGLPPGRGLMDALADPSTDVASLVIETDIPGLKVLPAGNTTNSDSEYLSSSRTAGVLDRLTQDAPHRIVIFDSPPALAATPASELAKHVGQALVICRADRTGQGALEDAISLLSGCPNIQLVLNAADFSPSGRRFGTYYGYGS